MAPLVKRPGPFYGFSSALKEEDHNCFSDNQNIITVHVEKRIIAIIPWSCAGECAYLLAFYPENCRHYLDPSSVSGMSV